MSSQFSASSKSSAEVKQQNAALIGIVGAGQLAQMMARAGLPLGLRFVFFAEPSEDTRCVDGLGEICRIDAQASVLFERGGRPAFITVEKEHVDLGLMSDFAKCCELRPSLAALKAFKNRLVEKRKLDSLNIPLADYCEVRNREDARAAFERFGSDGFLKSQEEGYDGYNQWRVTPESAASVLAEMPETGAWVFEKAIHFDCELSFIFVCADGKVELAYDPAWNTHREGQLLSSIVPAPQVDRLIIAEALRFAEAIASDTNYTGVLSIECFLVNGQLLVNEIAPRVHNSGHWSMHGALTSQFANHVRAVAGLPLTSVTRHQQCAMVNLLGTEPSAGAIQSERAFLYSYGKTQRERRKLGHINVVCESAAERDGLVSDLLNQIYGSC